TNTIGNTYQLLTWQILAHVVNHNTHHRGELAAMFSAMGAPHHEDDWIQYFLDTSGQRASVR
ncbi:MAG: DinB family protein, partial [Anaerolineales bacterium]